MITRRNLLLTALSTPIAGAAYAHRRQPGDLPSPFLVVLTGVDGATPHEKVSAIYKPFIERQIPVTVSLSPALKGNLRLSPRKKLVRALRADADRYKDLLEIAIHIEKMAGDSYSQLRQASIAQANFSWAMNPVGDHHKEALLTGLTLTTNTPLWDREDMASIRGAGLRTAIHLKRPVRDRDGIQPRDGGYWTTSTGLVNTFSTYDTTTMTPEYDSTPRSLEEMETGISRQMSSTPHPIVLHIPLSSLQQLSDRDIANHARGLAEIVAGKRDGGGVRGMLPYKLYTQSHEGPQRYVIVRVDDGRVSPGNEKAHVALINDFLAAGIPVTESVIPIGYGPGYYRPLSDDPLSKARLKSQMESKNYNLSMHGLEHLPSESTGLTEREAHKLLRRGMKEFQASTGIVPASYIPPNNVVDEPFLKALEGCGVALVSTEHRDYRWIWGMDEKGILHASNTVSFEKEWTGDIPYFEKDEILEHLSDKNDAVLMIHPATLNSPAKKQKLMAVLQTLDRQPQTALTSLSGYRNATMPKLASLELLQGSRRREALKEETSSDGPSDDELRKDAEHAWSYFDGFSERYNGLAPSTGWETDGKRQGYPFATMWDVASLIMANITARRFGFIDDSRFEKTVARIISFLGESTFRFGDGTLLHTERSLTGESGARSGFDVIDVGRLLVSLKILDRQTNGAFSIADMIGGWGLEAALPEGRMHDVSKGSLTSKHENIYAQYASRGFALWGFDLEPVYSEQRPLKNTDSAMTFLEEVRRRGPIATEPHTTEEIEVGASDHSKLIADIVLEAQMRRHEEEGVLTAASECPLDREPWFTYQGYQLNDQGGVWTVHAPRSNRAYETPQFAQKNRLISAKASYLWLATRPGPYSNALYRYIHEMEIKCATGFASGIYEKSGKRTSVSDINTNGIIMEAIFYMLNGRKPLNIS